MTHEYGPNNIDLFMYNPRVHVFWVFNLNIRVQCGAPRCRGAGPGRPQEQVHCLLVELCGHEARGELEVLRGWGVQVGWQQV